MNRKRPRHLLFSLLFLTLSICSYFASPDAQAKLSQNSNTINKKLSKDEVRIFSNEISRAFNIDLDPELKLSYSEWIISSAKKHRVPKYILAAMIMAESSFTTNARSSTGAIGPAQISPKDWNGRCPGNIFTPSGNIECGGFVLRHYFDEYCDKDWVCALKHYNVGPGNLKKGRKYQRSGEKYVEKINSFLEDILSI